MGGAVRRVNGVSTVCCKPAPGHNNQYSFLGSCIERMRL